MNKEAFLKELDEIIQDELFIGNSVDDLDDETLLDNWSISMGQELVSKFTTEDLITFFHQVQNNRKEQIVNTSDHNMIFYVWFDWQSARLHFNLISDLHTKLPFGCNHKVIENIEPILNDFLQFPYHDGFPIGEKEEKEVIENEFDIEPLKVYSIIITND
ncbi:hypothetical protein [Lysinibacillus sp. NPDC093692]|uniref:hypothetical protein n=1 Tax=Lysinibacillus sp. NPDC093692 TaxID=3390578 RepID=UPI003CFE2870